MDLRLRTRNLGAAELVEISGELDLHAAPPLRAALLKATEGEKSRVLLDLSEVTFLDSTGVGVLVEALKRARARGGEVHFCGAGARVKRVFEITGLLRVLPLFDSRDAALDAWKTPENDGALDGETEDVSAEKASALEKSLEKMAAEAAS